MRRIRRHLTYANVISSLALFLVLSGGAVYAANTIGSNDVIDDSLQSKDFRNGQAVKGTDVVNDSLTDADIADRNGVDTCVATVRIGSLCVRAKNFARTWLDAARHCANLDLRQPTLGEARQLATTHDIPNVDPDEEFWTADMACLPVGGLWPETVLGPIWLFEETTYAPRAVPPPRTRKPPWLTSRLRMSDWRGISDALGTSSEPQRSCSCLMVWGARYRGFVSKKSISRTIAEGGC